jgi:hypothetical protein
MTRFKLLEGLQFNTICLRKLIVCEATEGQFYYTHGLAIDIKCIENPELKIVGK